MPACWHGGAALGQRTAPLGYRPQRLGGVGLATRVGAGGLGPAIADLLDRRHGVAQVADPIRLVLGDQAYAPGQRLAAAARTPPSMSVSRTRRSAMRSRVMTGTPAVVKRISGATADGTPRDGPPEGRLGLVGDAHPGPAALLAEAADPGLFGHPPLVLVGALGELGRGQGAHDLDLVAVDLDGGAALEPVLGDPAGEPRPDQALLLRARRGRRASSGGVPAGAPLLGVFFCRSYYEIT